MRGGIDVRGGVGASAHALASASGRFLGLPSGAVGCSLTHRGMVNNANQASISDGVLRAVGMPLLAGATVTNLTFRSGTTAANGPTHWWFALYAPGVGGALLAQTADQTSTAWAASTEKTVALSAPVTITTSGLYYAAICMTASTAVISTAGDSAAAATTFGVAPIYTGNTADTGLTATAPATLGVITADVIIPYCYAT